MWPPASAIFASIVTILVSFEAILKRKSVISTLEVNYTVMTQSIKIALKLTSTQWSMRQGMKIFEI